MLELVVVNHLRARVFTLEIDSSEEFNHEFYEIPYVDDVLIERGS